MLIRFVTIFIFLCLATPSFATSFSGMVITVIDGDTIDVLHNKKPERIRLHGIDAPEIFWTILTMSNGVSGVVNETQSL